MNNIRLLLKGIKASIKESPVVYIVFVFFYIFSVICSIYVIGKYSSNLSAYDDYDNSLATFSVDFRLGGETRLNDILQAVEKNAGESNVDFIRLRFLDTELNEEAVEFHYAICYAKDEENRVSDYFEQYDINSLNAKEFINSENSIVAVIDSTNSNQTNQFELQGKQYEIAATLLRGKNEALFHLVSYKSVLINNPIIREMQIKYNSISGYDQLNQITYDLMADFPLAQVNAPIVRDYSLESIFSIGNVLVYLVLLLSVVNFIYIFQYIIEKRKKQYYIFFLCGCSSRKIMVFSGVEIFIVSAICSAVGIVLFHFAIKPLVIYLEPLLSYSFHIGMYLAVCALSIVVGCGVLACVSLFQKRGKVR